MTAVRLMPDPLPFTPLPVLRSVRVLLRGPRDSDIEDRLRHPIDPEEEDGYGSAWRREWDGRRYHTREHLAAARRPEPGEYRWAVEHNDRCVGSTGLRVDAGQHRATYAVGLFDAALRGQGLGREITRLVVAWGFGALGLHRIELEVLAFNTRAIRCYLACGFRREGVRREAELYPDGWKDLISMGLLRSEYET
jgi:ribosomal-protein-alanine N-acetyltransferase